MSKVRLFYSYSHEDEVYREELEKHLATLRDNHFIDEWHDRKIDAGDDWDEEIEKNMEASHVILLLFSVDFIDSKSCQKEVKRAMELKSEKGTIFIPIILRTCAWKDVNGISNIQGLPSDGNPIDTWGNKDEAWTSVYDGIKNKIEVIRANIKPTIKDEFKKDLLNNPIENCQLDDVFVYPDILKTNGPATKKLEKNEIDSQKLCDLNEFGEKYLLVEGEEQSGKTSLCNMLFSNYVDSGFYPILLNGMDICGKADIQQTVAKKFKNQYESTRDYWSIDKEKRILFIDDVDEWKANSANFSTFITSIEECFEYAILFIDKVSNLSDKSAEHNYFSGFQSYSIEHLGHSKRDEIIKKCIAHDEHMDFDSNNNEHLARLDKDTTHINSIIGANIVPSYPLFIVTIFHTVESATPHDLSHTSYGHCYHAMITMNLHRTGMKAGDIHACFNFLTEFSYFMFNKDSKSIPEVELNQFIQQYKQRYVIQENVAEELIKANIITRKNGAYSFTYIYIYYYFVAKHLSNKSEDEVVKKQIAKLISSLHTKDSANIIIFITHHSNTLKLLDEIIFNAMTAFDGYSEATLSGDEKTFIYQLSGNLESRKLPDSNHCIQTERKKHLQRKDEVAPIVEQMENREDGGNDDSLLIEIRKSAKSMEIIGQILKNQYGSLEKDKLKEMFEEGQNVGLRLLKSFMEQMKQDEFEIDIIIQSQLEAIAKHKGKELSNEEKSKISKKIISQFSYAVIFGWLHKIVDSLGYDKLVEITDDVNGETASVASKLINLYIHTWHAKKLNIDKIKALYDEFEGENNYQAIYILKDIISRHIYMHSIDDYRDKQKIASLLGFSHQNQIVVQQKIS
jgi:hypothetical protein